MIRNNGIDETVVGIGYMVVMLINWVISLTSEGNDPEIRC